MSAVSTEPLLVEIAVGELADKISILTIKSERLADPTQLANVQTELKTLQQVWDARVSVTETVLELCAELRLVNEKLWSIEDDIRLHEADARFDEQFIALARSVYITNERRSTLKGAINDAAGSRLREEKSYARY